jgi:hypothetical protein
MAHPPPVVALEDRIERRYLGLARLGREASAAADFRQLAAAVAGALEEPLGGAPGVRLWAITAEGIEELARHPAEADLDPLPPRELQRAAERFEPIELADGRRLAGLHAAGMSLGVLEVEEGAADAELLGLVSTKADGA